MAEIIAAVDETAATDVMHDAQASAGVLSDSGSEPLGPFTASYSASASFSGGAIDLIPADTIRITDLQMDYSLSFSFSFDLSDILPDFCIPQVCVDIPCVGEVCTPEICVDWPTVTIPVNHVDFLKFTGDFKLDVHLTGGNWVVDVVLLGIPSLQFGAATALLLAKIGLVAAAVLAPIPFIGPVLAIAVNLILAAIGIAGLTRFLGPIITPLVAGLRFTVYERPQVFAVLPASGPLNPVVEIVLDSVTADVDGSGGEDELVISIDISP